MEGSDQREKTVLFMESCRFPKSWIEEMAQEFPKATFLCAKDDELEAMVGEAHGLVGCPRHLFKSEYLENGRLEWMHSGGAGVEHFISDELAASDVTFTNGKIIQGPEVADHALALLLALTRNLHLELRDDPERPYPRALELHGKTALVCGLGGIGLLIAERAHAFGMRIIGTNADMVPMMRIIDHLYYPNELHEALGEADVVLSALPHTKETEKVFGYAEFSAMKESAFFINVSRGKVVDTEGLLQALQEEKIQGAGLDVTDPEPLAEDHALRALRNVIITPHMAGHSDFNRQRSFELTRENTKRFLTGLPLLNEVDKRLGY